MAKKILVVEDNELNLYLVTYLLSQRRYQVVAARTGLEAVDKARAQKPDLILMDIQMPEMDGYESTRRIKACPETTHIPVIAVSSYAMVGDRARALRAGCAGYIEKPITPDTFVSQIEQFM